MSKKVDVSFITINYNSTDYTIRLLESIFKYTTLAYEVIIVDNASHVDEYERVFEYCKDIDSVKLIRNRINSGFASGNMLGVNYADADYYFFINNDAVLLNDCAAIMKSYFDSHEKIALATAKVNDENGNFSSSYKLFPSLAKELFGNSAARALSSKKFPSNKIKLEVPTLVEVVSGSCMFFRAKTFCEIGGFDTTFFLYCEEEDISKRIWDNHHEVVFLPEAEIFHESGGSGERNYNLLQEYYISYKHLVKKHFSSCSSSTLLFLQLFKLFRRAFKNKEGFRLLLFGIKGFKIKESLKYRQKVLFDE